MKLNTFIKRNAMAIIAIIFAGSLMSFKVIEKEFAGTYYYYISNTDSGFNTTAKWDTANNNEACSMDGERPCKVLVPEGKTILDVVGGKSDAIILGFSEGHKP